MAENGKQQSGGQRQNRQKKSIHWVIEKIRNLPEWDDAGPSTGTNNYNQEQEKNELEPDVQENEELEITSSDTEHSIAVAAINFRRYLGATR